jgi:RNA polymerase sigma-70 factor (ECF subfamily)
MSQSEQSNDRFQPTAWTRILSAREGSDTTVAAVLEDLAQLYWRPVYFHVRRKGYSSHDAEDLTQQFFATFIERGALMKADRNKGKFRTFLLTSVNYFLCDEYDKRNAMKRTPNLDFEAAHPQFVESNTFDRDWATLILGRAFARLRDVAPQEAEVVEAQRGGKIRHKELAEKLGLSEANVRVMAHRGRKKMRAIILEELRETTTSDAEAEEELSALFRALSS